MTHTQQIFKEKGERKAMRNKLVIFSLIAISFFLFSTVSALQVYQPSSSRTSSRFYTGNLTNLSEMADVNIPTPSEDDVLTYDDTTRMWLAASLPSWTAQIEAANTTMANYVDGTFFTISDWNTNYTANNNNWNNRTNLSYYLSTNPFSFYNSTTLPASSETFWNANYSTFLTHISWAEAINGTLALSSSLSNYLTISDWNANYTSNNDAWLNTTNLTYDGYNSTGLIKDWNATRFIKNWTVDINSANATLYNWVVAQGYATDGISWADVANGTLFTQELWNTNYTANDAVWRNNTGILWSEATNGTLLSQSDWNTNYTANNDAWLNTTNLTYDAFNSSGLIRDWNATGFIVNWSLESTTENDPFWSANYTIFNDTWSNNTGILWSEAINGTLLTTALWNTNYTANNANWNNRTNLSYYLSSNPFSFYNSTTAPIYINDTFAGNYSNFTTVYNYALNNTGISWSEATNGTLFTQEDWNTNYTANNDLWLLDTDTFQGNYSAFLALPTLTEIINFGYYNLTDFDIGDYLTKSDWNANYTSNNDAWLNTTNLSYYPTTNPFGFYNATNTIPIINTSYVVKTGDTMTGDLTAPNFNTTGWYQINGTRLSSTHIIDHDGHSIKDTFNHIINRGVTEAITVGLTGGLGVNWTAGSVYDASTETFVFTDAGSGTLTSDQVNYLKYTGTSTLELSTSPSSDDEILVAKFSNWDGIIAGYRETSLLDNSLSDARRGLRIAFPNRIISGMDVHEDTDVTNSLDVSMDAGQIIKDGISENNPTAIDSRTLPLVRLFHSGGDWTNDSNAEIDTLQYDNGTDLVNIPTNKYAKGYFIYAAHKLGFVYPTTYYNTKAQAEASALSPIPEGLSQVPKLTAVVYQQGDTDFSNAVWQDIRPGISEESFNIVTDHGALAGLGDDDHPQYLLAEGTRNATKLDATNNVTAKYFLGDGSFLTGINTEETFWNANYSTFLTHISWADAINGTLLSQEDWNTNYTANNNNWNNRTNLSYYLATNPFSFYNSTTAPIYINDTFAGNYSNFTTVYNYALNNTGISWENAVNGTLLSQSDWNTNYTANNDAWLNTTNLSYYPTTNPFGFYNSSDFDISNYYLKPTSYPTILGYLAGIGNTQNTVTILGYGSGTNNIGTYATMLGYYAGYDNSGNNLVAVGHGAGQTNSVGRVTAIGFNSGQTNSGERSSFVGYLSGKTNTGSYSVGMGAFSLYQNTGNNVSAIGYASGNNNSGNNGVFIGYKAGQHNTLENAFILKSGTANSDALITGDFATGNVAINENISATYFKGDGSQLTGIPDNDTTYTAGNGITLTDTIFSVAGNTALTQDADGLSVTADGIGDTQLEYNTGQHLTTTSNPTFKNVTVEGIRFEKDSTNHMIFDNSTCIIIKGDTSIMEIC